jgi:hypothetical protein
MFEQDALTKVAPSAQTAKPYFVVVDAVGVIPILDFRLTILD